MSSISVVMPTFQRAHLIAQTLQMLLRQTRLPLEIVVADDGSTDGTEGIVAALGSPLIKYLKRDHLGMPGILNEAIAASRGDYVMVCHDHDVYHPSLLEEMGGLLDRHPSAVIAHCGILGVDPTGEQVTLWYIREHAELENGRAFLTDEMLRGLHSPITALTMFRRDALGGRLLDPRFRGCADVELWMRLCTRGDVAYVGKPLISVRQRDSGSVFHSAACELAALVLSAKREYLSYVSDVAERDAIERRWRREIDGTALMQMRDELRAGSVDQLASIRGFVFQYGTRLGSATAGLLCAMPAPLASLALSIGWAGRRLVRLSLESERRIRGVTLRTSRTAKIAADLPGV